MEQFTQKVFVLLQYWQDVQMSAEKIFTHVLGHAAEQWFLWRSRRPSQNFSAGIIREVVT